jgi:beta-glucosidase
VQQNGVGTSLKHFAVNNQETQRMGNDARVSQRALREIYLKGFQIAIEKAQPWTVMTSYNLINGTMTSESKELLNTVLRKEWGFKGLIMTDWFGGMDPVRRNGLADRIANMQAGNDLIEPGTEEDSKAIVEAVKCGKLKEADLNANVRRVLELIVRSPRFKGYQFSNNPDLKGHATITRNSAVEGAVLLKNDGTLPFNKNIKKLAVYGCSSYDIIAGGTGSGNVNRGYTISLIEGLRNNGYTVNQDILEKYQVYLDDFKKAHANDVVDILTVPELPKEITFSTEDLAKSVSENDAALITIGRICGEGSDRCAKDFNLSDAERQLISTVSDAFQKAGKTVTVILNIGNVMETASWKNIPNAILLPWQSGQEVGNSIADILSGRKTPSGKLSDTWPIRLEEHYSSKNFPLDAPKPVFLEKNRGDVADEKNVGYTNYEEDIYVGYRYFDTFKVNVSYPFGYGLSYTTFAYSNPTVTDNGDDVEVSVTITNTGKYSGKEVAEVYVTAPAGEVEKPEQELKAFAKTKELQPGESQMLTMTIAKADLGSFHENQSAWITDAGTYLFKVGASSRDIKGTASLNIKQQKTKVNPVLKPQVTLNLLTNK